MTEFVALGSNHRWTDDARAMPERPAWQADAACAGVGTELFFADASGQFSAEALAVCNTCPVRVECLDWALANGDDEGVWGGMTASQRRRLRRRRNASPKVAARRVEARRLHQQGLSQDEIARALGVGQGTISVDLEATS